MPVLTAIKGEIGTSGEIERVDVRRRREVPIIGRHAVAYRGWRDRPMSDAIADAVGAEHCCGDTDTCDIARALEDGYAYVAADLLQGATETPLLDAVLMYYGKAYADALAEQWPQWTEHFRSIARMCPACGGATMGDEFWTPEECGHCGAELPA